MAKVIQVRIFPNINQTTSLLNFLIPIDIDWNDEAVKDEILEQLLHKKLPQKYIEEGNLLKNVKKAVGKTDIALVKNDTGVYVAIFVYRIPNSKVTETLNRVRNLVGTLEILPTPYYPSE